MNWRVVIRPEVEQDVAEAASWYDSRQAGLGAEFVEDVIRVWDALEANPLLNSRRHLRKNIRWRYPERFPYRVIYEVVEGEQTVIVAAVLHAARHDRHWQQRVEGDGPKG
jgi:toxin ParE1/3/4